MVLKTQQICFYRTQVTPARRPWGPVYGRCTTWKGCHQVVEEGWSTETSFLSCRDNLCFGLNSLGPLCLWQCFFSLLLKTGAKVSSHWRCGWQGGLWWPLLLFAKGSVKSPALADFWIIAFEHFHYVTAFVIFAKYFLFLQNLDVLAQGFPVMTLRHSFVLFFYNIWKRAKLSGVFYIFKTFLCGYVARDKW